MKAENKDIQKEAEAQGEKALVGYWEEQIRDSEKREKDFRKKAKEVQGIYEMEQQDRLPYNILYSNTETLSSALYNSLPRPQVERRFKDPDPLAKATSESISRFLSFFMDSNDRDYSDFDQMMESAVKEALVPGRGISRFKLDATIEEVEISSVDQITGQLTVSREERVSYATVCGEEVSWDRIHMGYAKRWSQVPWIAFDHFMSMQELRENFGEEWAKKIPLTVVDKKESSGVDDATSQNPRDLGEVSLARVCEVWDKRNREVLFFAPAYQEAIIKKVPDPLELSGFFPIPRPLLFGRKISSLIPIPLYTYYEEQAKELNRLTIRINRIIKALRVRGLYDQSLDGIAKVLEADDNVLLPVENVAALQEGRTLEKSLWLVPIDKYPAILQQLYLQREQVKAIIQELTGIADIMRGSTRASETLGAQEIKAQWGGLRLQTLRKRVQYYVRDCLRIVAEIGFKHIPPELLAKMVNFQFDTQIWQQIIALANDDMLRNFKVDIETDSTIEADTTQDKKDIGEFLNSLAQFLNGAMPLVQGGLLPFEVMKAIMMTVTRKYRFGQEVETSLEQMKPPPPQPNPEAEKQQMETAKMQQDLQKQEQLAQVEAQSKLLDHQLKQMDAQVKIRDLERKDAIAQRNFEIKMKDLERKAAEGEIKAVTSIHQESLKQEVAEHKAEQAMKVATEKEDDSDATS